MQNETLSNDILDQVTVLILAGGRGQRMNGVDKGLMTWQDKPMVEHVIARLNAPKEKIIISANRNIETYQQYASQVINDDISFNQENFQGDFQGSFQGPLMGILSAMKICATPYLLCLPCDSPTPPENLLVNLWQCQQKQKKHDALCHDGERLQPLFSLLSCQHKTLLENFLQQGRRKVHDFMNLIDPAICDFSVQKNNFNNFNQPDDMR